MSISVAINKYAVTASGTNYTVSLSPQMKTVEVRPSVITIDAATKNMTAGESLSALRAVTVGSDGRVIYADVMDVATRNVIGVTETAAAEDATVRIRHQHHLTDSSWSWTPGQPVYVGAGGVLTQTPPSATYIVHVGVAISATSIFIDIQPPIILQ